jgi:hypothetical protein
MEFCNSSSQSSNQDYSVDFGSYLFEFEDLSLCPEEDISDAEFKGQFCKVFITCLLS